MTKEIEQLATHFLIAAHWADGPEGAVFEPTATDKSNAWTVAADFYQHIGDYGRHCIREAARQGYGAHPDCCEDKPPQPFAAAGHDLYLTIAGHGAGFWDRDELDEGFADYLTNVCCEHFQKYNDLVFSWEE